MASQNRHRSALLSGAPPGASTRLRRVSLRSDGQEAASPSSPLRAERSRLSAVAARTSPLIPASKRSGVGGGVFGSPVCAKFVHAFCSASLKASSSGVKAHSPLLPNTNSSSAA